MSRNIFLIPTDKPSSLWITKLGNIARCNDAEPIKKELGYNINVYIISDEEAKEGDWGYIPFEGGNVKLVGKYFADDWKKIILTTDQDLIKDGVQAIDDEFLEWFVSNPSCEEVKVKEIEDGDCVINGREYVNYSYEIILPQEEPKTETVEEAAEKQYPTNWPKSKDFEDSLLIIGCSRAAFKLGAKWQSERMFSKDEVYILCSKAWLKTPNAANLLEDFNTWFEKHIKK